MSVDLSSVIKPVILFSALSLTACSRTPVMPDLPELTPAFTQQLPTGSAEQALSPTLTSWWQALADPVLNRLLQQVFTHNPSLTSAGISYQIALLQAGVSTSDYRPKGSLSAGASEARQDSRNSHNFNLGANVSWELDIWGTRRAEKAKANAASERSLDELHAAQVSLIAQTVQGYISLRAAQQHQTLAQQAIELRQQSYDLARWQHSAGLATELQQAQALTLLKQAEANLPPHQQSINEALNQLQSLAGGELETLRQLLAQPQALPTTPLQAISIEAELLRQRPDVQAKEKAIKEQNEAIILARHARYPSFSLTGRISSSNQQVSELFSAQSVVSSLAANLAYVLFDGGSLRTNIKVQKLRLEQSLEDYRMTLLTAQQEVSNALTALDANQRQQDSYQQALASAQLAANLAKMQYDYGLLNFNELLDAQTALLNSRSALLNNQAAVLNAWVLLYRSLGGGWQATPETLMTGTDSE